MAQSIENALVPISQVPPEVISLIPDYCETNQELIALTHVRRSWREIFISRASLWTHLDCTDLGKTNVYIQRSRGSLIEISIATTERRPDAFCLVHSFIGRFKTLTLSGFAYDIVKLVGYLSSPSPLLEKLDIQVRNCGYATIEGTLLGGNLLSLRELRLYGVNSLKWRQTHPGSSLRSGLEPCRGLPPSEGPSGPSFAPRSCRYLSVAGMGSQPT